MAQNRAGGDLPPDVVERAIAGDEDSSLALVRHYDGGLRSLAYRVLGDRDRMDDALQEAYVKAFRSLPTFRGGAKLGTWLYRIAYNACLDELERGRRIVPLPLAAVEAEADLRSGTDDRVERRVVVAEALRALSVADRAAVLLVDAHGFTYEEAAQILDVPSGTVGSRLNRARAALRLALGTPTQGAVER
jgi:RNA polymerase sigma-70 factor (ECF subfamily)